MVSTLGKESEKVDEDEANKKDHTIPVLITSSLI